MDKKEQSRLRAAKYRESNRDKYNAKMREWNARNKERINREERERRANDPEYAEKVRAIDRARYAKDPSKRKATRLKSNYGMSIADYNLMYDKQCGRCAICGDERKRGGSDGLVVDHCHNKGHVRGLLCSSCNNGLGRFKDSIESLKKAADYLMKYSEGENHVSTQ